MSLEEYERTASPVGVSYHLFNCAPRDSSADHSYPDDGSNGPNVLKCSLTTQHQA